MTGGVGRKQTTTDADWEAAWTRIRSGDYDFDGLAELADQTVSSVRTVITGKRVAYGWSGGKDSLALMWVMNQAGVRDCVLVRTNLEYPAFEHWALAHHPEECEVINTGQDLDWLVANPEMLFPAHGQIAAKWFRLVQHTGQTKFYRERGLDLFAVGRRKADGNFTGRGPVPIYKNGRGVVRYSPLADWKHEDVLALIHRENIPLPPIYGWPRGYQVGTGPWAARQWVGTTENGWRELNIIDPAIVEAAAPAIPSARRFLRGGGER